jgi:hypothetical protein
LVFAGGAQVNQAESKAGQIPSVNLPKKSAITQWISTLHAEPKAGKTVRFSPKLTVLCKVLQVKGNY